MSPSAKSFPPVSRRSSMAASLPTARPAAFSRFTDPPSNLASRTHTSRPGSSNPAISLAERIKPTMKRLYLPILACAFGALALADTTPPSYDLKPQALLDLQTMQKQFVDLA